MILIEYIHLIYEIMKSNLEIEILFAKINNDIYNKII